MTFSARADCPGKRCSGDEFLREGGEPDPVHMNCSGKHAAMLATCVAAGWPTDSYPHRAHPLQVALRRSVEGLAGEQFPAAGVDGCGAPVFALTLACLARAFQALVTAPACTPERRVADAMLGPARNGRRGACARSGR